MSDLPHIRYHNRNWKLVGEGPTTHWIGKDVDAEVVSIHLRARKIRVRFYNDWWKKWQAHDIPIDEFEKNYAIVERQTGPAKKL